MLKLTAVILLDSVTGNTRRIAEEAKNELLNNNVDCNIIDLKELKVPLAGQYLDEPRTKETTQEAHDKKIKQLDAEALDATIKAIEDTDIIIAASWNRRSSWSYAFRRILPAFENKNIFIILTSGSVRLPYAERCKSKLIELLPNTTVVHDIFICQGKMRPSVREKYLRTHTKGHGKRSVEQKIANFDEALKHPNEEDFEAVREFTRRAIKITENNK